MIGVTVVCIYVVYLRFVVCLLHVDKQRSCIEKTAYYVKVFAVGDLYYDT